MDRKLLIALMPFILLLVAGCVSGPRLASPDGSGDPRMRRNPPAQLDPGEPISLNALSYTPEELTRVNRLAVAGASLVLPERWIFFPPADGTVLTRPELGATAFYFANPEGTITGQVQRFVAPFRNDSRSLAEYYINALRPDQEIIRSQPIRIAGLRGFVVFLDAAEAEAPMVVTLILDAGEDGQVAVEVADLSGGMGDEPLPILQLLSSLSVSHPATQERTLAAGMTFADPENRWSWIGDLGGGMILYPTESEAPYTVVIGPRARYSDGPLATLVDGRPADASVELEMLVATEVVTMTAQDHEVAGRRRTVVDFEAAGRAWRRRSSTGGPHLATLRACWALSRWSTCWSAISSSRGATNHDGYFTCPEMDQSFSLTCAGVHRLERTDCTGEHTCNPDPHPSTGGPVRNAGGYC